ncbi:MAG: Pycsar system effector family protein [Chitinophagaceae bacterium]
MTSTVLLQNVEQYVRDLFVRKVDSEFYYHNITHTEYVVEATLQMADYYQLSEEEKTVLLIAAWFHDSGFSKGKPENHEAEGQLIASNFLQKNNAASYIQKVNGCIAATKMPQSPNNLLEQILCDADLSHLGTTDFIGETKSLRRELMKISGVEISKKDWRQNNIQFLQQHTYFTDYAENKLERVKQENLALLLSKETIKSKTPDEENLPVKKKEPGSESTLRNNSLEEKKKKEKENRTERGVGTMFRIMSDNHVSLSQMADSKANIMISVNTIVLSILVSVLFSKLQYYPQFTIPTIILCGVCLFAIIFAILATRPNITKGTFDPEDVEKKKINLLFFGNFFKMPLTDYEWAMKEMMNDREYLYGSMIKDIYFLGKVLARKYKFLRLSYNIFMFGLVVSIAAFIIAFIATID